MEFSVNEDGKEFYYKLYKDTRNSIYIVGPLLLVFFCTCFVLITGLTIKTLYILILPVSLIYLAFYYSSFYMRGKILNQMIKKIRKQGEIIEVETFSWFYMKPKTYRTDKNNFILIKSSKNILNIKDGFELANHNSMSQEAYFFVESFFDVDVLK